MLPLREENTTRKESFALSPFRLEFYPCHSLLTLNKILKLSRIVFQHIHGINSHFWEAGVYCLLISALLALKSGILRPLLLTCFNQQRITSRIPEKTRFSLKKQARPFILTLGFTSRHLMENLWLRRHHILGEDVWEYPVHGTNK